MAVGSQREGQPKDQSTWTSPTVIAALIAAVASIIVALMTFGSPNAANPQNEDSGTANSPGAACEIPEGNISGEAEESPDPEAAIRRTGKITLPHDWSKGYSVDLDTDQPDWRFEDDQYRDGVDLVGDCCSLDVTAASGILKINIKASAIKSTATLNACISGTGYVDRAAKPARGEIYCVKTDQSRYAVVKILGDALDSGKTVVQVVVW